MKPTANPDRFVVKAISSFSEGPIEGVVFQPLARHDDGRGWLIEFFRQDELSPDNHPAMAYASETLPGVARGPHAHQDQTDCFAFIGPGMFKLVMWDTRSDSSTYGRRLSAIVGEANRQRVIVPPGVVHGYRNIGSKPALVWNCPNRLYAGHGKTKAVDEIRYEEWDECPFVLD